MCLMSMLFLGAGASNAFGIGQLRDFTPKVDEILDSSGYSDLRKHIHVILREANKDSAYFVDEFEIDMEVILSVLDALVNPTQKSRDLGPSMKYMSQLANNSYSGGIPTISELQTIKKSIEDLIINSCDNFDFERAKEYYRSLFNFENSVTPFYVNAKNEHPRIPIFSHTVTTNYDLVLERYDKECDTDSTLPAKHFLRRGFIRPYNEAEPELRIGEMDPKFEYLKLHGSVDWWISKRDGRIIARDCFHSLMGVSATVHMFALLGCRADLHLH
jgi:hypothetical protein